MNFSFYEFFRAKIHSFFVTLYDKVCVARQRYKKIVQNEMERIHANVLHNGRLLLADNVDTLRNAQAFEPSLGKLKILYVSWLAGVVK